MRLRPEHLLLAVALAVPGCASVEPAWRRTFGATFESATVTRVEFDASRLAPAAGSLLGLCGCVRVSLDRGFRYFRIDERVRLRHGVGTMRLEHFAAPPVGAEIVGTDSSPFLDSVDDAVYDAESFVVTCRELAAEPTGG